MLSSAVRFASRTLFSAAVLGLSSAALAQAIPLSLAASPDIYKVIAENDQYRIVEVTWKPGQRDKAHSHPMSGVYNPMDCTLRAYGPEGQLMGERSVKAGSAAMQAPIPGHSVENAGTSVCKVIMFEPK